MLKKTIITVVLLLDAGGAGYAYWRMGNGPKGAAVSDHAGAARQIFARWCLPRVRLQAVTTVLVGSQVSGTIAKLFANFNTKVK